MPGVEPDDLARRIADAADPLVPASARAEFSESGYEEFTSTVTDYISDLANETYRETRRHRADRVTPDYVRKAAEKLMTPRRRIVVTFLGGLGGILLGAGVASIPSWVGAKTIDPGQALVVLGLAVIGASLLVFAFALELAGR